MNLWSALKGVGNVLRSAAKPSADTNAATPPNTPAPAVNPYKVANEQIRKTATWLIGALSAVAAILLAGSQLSSIGKLPLDDWRLTIAGLSAAAAIGAVIFAIYRLSLILAPVTTPLMDLRAEANNEKSEMVAMVASDVGLTGGYGSIVELLTAYDTDRNRLFEARRLHRAARAELEAAVTEAAKAATAKNVQAAEGAEQRADADVMDLRRPVERLGALLGHLTLTRRFKDERSRVTIASTVGALAILTFAWAANPPNPAPGAIATLPAKPVPVTLYLTPAGVDELSSILGARCAQEALNNGTPAIALSVSAEGTEVVLTGNGPCNGPVRITLDSRLAHIGVTTEVTAK